MRWALETKQTKMLALVKFNLYKPSTPYSRRAFPPPYSKSDFSLDKAKPRGEFAPVNHISNSIVSHKSW